MALPGNVKNLRKGPSVHETPQFRVELIREAGDTAVVAVTGELDSHTCNEFKRYLHEAIEEGAGNVVVDLTGVTFIDSAALGVIIGSARRLAPHRSRLSIDCLDNSVGRVLRIVGMDRVFPVRTLD